MEEAYSKQGWGYHIAISDNGKEAVKFDIRKFIRSIQLSIYIIVMFNSLFVPRLNFIPKRKKEVRLLDI